MLLKKSILQGFLFLSLLGCGMNKKESDASKAESNPSDWVKNTAKEFQLMGSWNSDCKGSNLLNAHKIESYTFHGDIFTHVEKYFLSSGKCEADPSVTVSYEGNFKVKNINDDVEDARNVNFDYKTSSVTVHGDSGVNLLSTINSCGVTNWEKDKTYNVTGHGGSPTCPIYKVPQERYDIAKLENNTLYFGHSSGFTLVKSRPSGVDRNDPYKK